MTDAQLAANRQNARKSTGPQTAKGKRQASQNSRTHGVLARPLCLPGEDPVLLAALHEQFRMALRPIDAVDEFLVERMVEAVWRLRRIPSAEARVLAGGTTGAAPGLRLGVVLLEDERPLATLARYEVTLERRYYRAAHHLERRQAARAGQPVLPPVAVDVELEGFREGAAQRVALDSVWSPETENCETNPNGLDGR